MVNEAIINGYRLSWNGFWNMFQVSHDEIGACIAEFKKLGDAIEYCQNG